MIYVMKLHSFYFRVALGDCNLCFLRPYDWDSFSTRQDSNEYYQDYIICTKKRKSVQRLCSFSLLSYCAMFDLVVALKYTPNDAIPVFQPLSDEPASVDCGAGRKSAPQQRGAVRCAGKCGAGRSSAGQKYLFTKCEGDSFYWNCRKSCHQWSLFVCLRCFHHYYL